MHKIKIDRILCKECGICVEMCPNGVIDFEKEEIDSEECKGCKICVYYCPDFAIEVI